MQRASIGDDLHAISDAEPVQILPVMLEFGLGHGFIHPARLQEAVELGAKSRSPAIGATPGA